MNVKPASRSPLPYILIADAETSRVSMCVAESMGATGDGIVVAGDGERAMALLVQLGPPRLLVVDLTLAGKDGFSVIEALRLMDEGRSAVIGWSAPQMREFARHRLSAFDVTLLRATAPAAVFRSAVDSLMKRHLSSPGNVGSIGADETDERAEELAAQARKITRARGIAVYIRTRGSESGRGDELRAYIDWSSNEPMPGSPELLPHLAHTVLDTGETIAWPDLAGAELMQTWLHAGIRGVVAVPVAGGSGEREGAIILFDTEPIALRKADVDALGRLGGTAPAAASIAAPVSATGSERPDEPPTREPLALATRPSAGREELAPFRGRIAPSPLADRATAEFMIRRELARMRREATRLSIVLFGMTSDTERPENILPFDPIAAARETLARASRGSDLAVHWDDERLLLLLPGLGEVEARRVAERLRASMQAAGAHHVTVSGGVAELGSSETFDVVVGKADERLRLARAKGANRIA